MKYTTLFYSIFMLMLHASSSLKGMENIEQKIAALKTKKSIEESIINNHTQQLERIKKIQNNPDLASRSYQTWKRHNPNRSLDDYMNHLKSQKQELITFIASHQQLKEKLEKDIDTLERELDRKIEKPTIDKPTRINF